MLEEYNWKCSHGVFLGHHTTSRKPYNPVETISCNVAIFSVITYTRLRAANRKPRRATSQKAVQEMILLLQRKSANKGNGNFSTNIHGDKKFDFFFFIPVKKVLRLKYCIMKRLNKGRRYIDNLFIYFWTV